MNLFDHAAIFTGVLFLGMLVLLETGRRIGNRQLARDSENARQGLGAVDGAVFALLGLLIAFSFSGAAGRFDTRRQLVMAEANNIGTAYLRIDLLPAGAQPALRELFRQYLDARIATYQKISDLDAAKAELTQSLKLQNEIWTGAVSACRDSGSSPTTTLLLPAINDMIDITSIRAEALRNHPPPVIFLMLGVLALTTSLLAGYGMAGGKKRSWIHILGFALIITLTIYVIMDIEYPRLGLIRVDSADQMLIELRQTMN